MSSLPSRVVLPLLACVTLTAAANANQVVVLTSGNRLEVEQALPVAGESYHLKLVGGGSLVLPASSVRRISNDAADMARKTAPIVTASATGFPSTAGGAQQPGGSGSTPPASHRTPMRYETSDTLRIPRLEQLAEASTAGAPAALAPAFASKVHGGVGTQAALAGQSVAAQARRRASNDPRFANFRRTGGSGDGTSRSVMRPMTGDPGRGPGLPRL